MILVVVPVSLLALIYGIQNKLIYPSSFPPGSRDKVDTPEEYHLPFESIALTSIDGTQLHSYFIKSPNVLIAQQKPIILYLQARFPMGNRLSSCHRGRRSRGGGIPLEMNDLFVDEDAIPHKKLEVYHHAMDTNFIAF
jgi:hypothetical protein